MPDSQQQSYNFQLASFPSRHLERIKILRCVAWFACILPAAVCHSQADTNTAASSADIPAGEIAEAPPLPTYLNGKLLDFIPNQTRMELAPPPDAVVLLGPGTIRFLHKEGSPLNWPSENGVITSTNKGEKKDTNHIVSDFHFRDAEIHVEFKLPVEGQGNSGIYIHGNYEMQILNSFEKGKTNELTHHDIGALYGFAKPLSNASKQAGEWQVYDIRYRAPRRDNDGSIISWGEVSAWLNGVLVQHGTTFAEPRSVYHPFRYHTTDYLKKIWEQQKKTSVGPVFLQDHGAAVQFRNVWVKPLDDKAMTYPAAENNEADEN